MEEIFEINGKEMTVDEVLIECKKMSALYREGKIKATPFEEIMIE